MCCSPALVHTHRCLFILISVLLLVPICPRSFIHTQLCWLAWPPFMLDPIPLLVPICPHSFICTRLCWLGQPPFVVTTTHLCASPFFCPDSVALPGPCAHHHLFMLVSIRLLVPVCHCPFVSTWLCLSPLPGDTCLAFAFACAHWCSFGFICTCSASFRTRLGPIMLIYTLMGFFWAPKPVYIKYTWWSGPLLHMACMSPIFV